MLYLPEALKWRRVRKIIKSNNSNILYAVGLNNLAMEITESTDGYEGTAIDSLVNLKKELTPFFIKTVYEYNLKRFIKEGANKKESEQKAQKIIEDTKRISFKNAINSSIGLIVVGSNATAIRKTETGKWEHLFEPGGSHFSTICEIDYGVFLLGGAQGDTRDIYLYNHNNRNANKKNTKKKRRKYMRILERERENFKNKGLIRIPVAGLRKMVFEIWKDENDVLYLMDEDRKIFILCHAGENCTIDN
ncbi:hypothetical protein GMMP15_670017 [Candidatus Magnetomoraceae bacterium gMMP-15]